MSGESSIQWTDATWNPTRGCSIVSEGCHNCYAMKQAHRFSGEGQWAEGLTKATRSGPQWTGKVYLNQPTLSWPLGYGGHPDAIKEDRPTRIFVNSMSDLFHESLSDEDIAHVFAVIGMNTQHTFQVLTKRSRRMREFCSKLGRHHEIDIVSLAAKRIRPEGPAFFWKLGPNGWSLPNLWLGVSAENQERADERIPDLLATPAAVRFVSAEPLLGPIDFNRLPRPFEFHASPHGWMAWLAKRLHWVIIGGESGPHNRQFDADWGRDILNVCLPAGIATFFKQMGSGWSRHTDIGRGRHISDSAGTDFIVRDSKGGDMAEWPDDLRVREMPEVR